VIAWTEFTGESRRVFHAAMEQDEGTWARARGWLLWKSLLVLSRTIGTDPEQAAAPHRLINEVLTDHDHPA
jgi:hypothetical protein